jgi:hypothetical protein
VYGRINGSLEQFPREKIGQNYILALLKARDNLGKYKE